jgi:dTDP-4-dehydrorhamnose 3,5-epimerase
MRFTETRLRGAFVIDPDRHPDERGHFARTYCEREFSTRGLNTRWVHGGLSYNRTKGTLRGLHWQVAPHEEVKLVRCARGSVHDVIVDLRPGSETLRGWIGVELSAENGRLLYVPKGFAHGFVTLADDTEVTYRISEYYHPESARGVRWDDPTLGIAWPLRPAVISARDSGLPGLAT